MRKVFKTGRKYVNRLTGEIYIIREPQYNIKPGNLLMAQRVEWNWGDHSPGTVYISNSPERYLPVGDW